jgi:putative ABC transport system permease protein
MSDRTHWRDHIQPHLASLRLDPAREAEIIEEISQHLDERCDELLNDGAAPEHARREALNEWLETDAFIAAS